MIDNVTWFVVGYLRVCGAAVIIGCAASLFTAAALWRVRQRVRKADKIPRARAVKLDAVTFDRVRRGEITAFSIAHTLKCQNAMPCDPCRCPVMPVAGPGVRQSR